MSNTKKSDSTIAVNKKARHDFTIEHTYEAGVVLEGWEVKSIRAGKIQITDSYVLIKQGEAWLVGTHIHPLTTASTHINPEPDRTRKLLLHQIELDKLVGRVERQGYTVVALKLYWKKNRVKAEIALGKGKKTHDKRAALKEKDWNLQKARMFKGG